LRLHRPSRPLPPIVGIVCRRFSKNSGHAKSGHDDVISERYRELCVPCTTRDAQTIVIGQIDEVRIMAEGEISLPIEPELLQLIHALSPGARLRNITYLRAPLMIIHPVMNPPITAPTMAAQNSFQLRNQEKKCSKRCKACTVSFIRNWPVHFEFNAIFDTAWNGDNPSERQPDVSRTFKLPRE